MHFFSLKKTSGFTLVELLVTTAIMGFVAIGLATINASNAERAKREMFQNNVDTLLTYFRGARTDAITNRVVGGETPEGGFGVHLLRDTENNTLKITYFADTQDAGGTGVGDGQYTTSSPSDEVFKEEVIQLIWGINFENPSPSGTYNENELTVLFLPPNAEMKINDNVSTNDMRSVEIVASYKQTQKRVCLNRISRFFEVLTGDLCS